MQIAFYLNSTWMSNFGLGGRGPIAVAVSLSGAEYLQCDTGAIESRDGGGACDWKRESVEIDARHRPSVSLHPNHRDFDHGRKYHTIHSFQVIQVN